MTKKILITGVNSGIGKHLFDNLSSGYQIIGTSRKLLSIDNSQIFIGDINDEDFLLKLRDQIDDIDYLILNAGVGYFDRFDKLSLREHKEIIQTNLTSNIILTHLLLENIKTGIIFIGSHSAKKSQKNGSSYMASKFGLRGFAMGLKNDLSLDIHIVNPKIVKTNFHNKSKIKIQGKYPETKIEDITKTIKNIIKKEEKRFEIDL